MQGEAKRLSKMTPKSTKACVGLLLAVACLLAATGTVEASRMGAMRTLSQSRGVAGVYCHNGEGIVVVNTVSAYQLLQAPGLPFYALAEAEFLD